MRVTVIANEEQEREIRSKETNKKIQLVFRNDWEGVEESEHDAMLILNQDPKEINFAAMRNKPVIIGSVIQTLSELEAPANVSRINAWPGFLQRETWEICEYKNQTESLFKNLGWKRILVKDEPGFVSARVISMIINEAFFAFGEKVSTMEEIDLAMKSGTNYPYGPFEWAEKIGLANVLNLLQRLYQDDSRYHPSTALEKCIFDSNF